MDKDTEVKYTEVIFFCFAMLVLVSVIYLKKSLPYKHIISV